MSPALDPNDPIAVLLAVDGALRAGGVKAALYGGLALAAYGEPRETKDADLAVVGVPARACLELLEKAGLSAQLAFADVTFGGLRISRITLFGSEPGVNTADLVEPVSPDYGARALDRAKAGTLRGEPLLVLTPEDFILFKVLSTRERDVEDAITVFEAFGGRLDVDLLAREADLLARTTPGHDVGGRLARVLR